MQSESLRILLIDDNPDDRELARRAVAQDFPYADFVEVRDEEDLQRELARDGFEIVITDYRLGWSDGLTVFHQIRERFPEVEVIMFTNTGSEETCAAGMKTGLFDYIIKRREQFPKLPAAVRAALDTQHTRRRLQENERRLSELLERERNARGEAEEARREAERANRLKDEFLATVSHELRTPLNAMLGWSALLLSGDNDPEEIREGLEVIQRNAKSQAKLIEDLLDLSRIVSGKLRIDVQSVELSGAIHAAVDAVRLMALQRGISITEVLDPNAGPVMGDSSRIQQIVANLLTNAIKFTPEGGKVQVSLEKVASHVEIAVSDTGIGIRPDLLPQIFDRFRQGDSSTTRKHGGLGIGLAIVKSLAQLHGGRVVASSEGEGKGARFTVCLPIVAAREKDVEALEDKSSLLSSPETTERLKGLRVLTVDDDRDSGDLVVRVLQLHGVDVEYAASVSQAMLALHRTHFDLLLSDIGMPDADGYDLIAQVRDLPPEQNGRIPAAALTAFSRSEDRQRALLAGFDTHLSKPVDPNELLAVVAALAKRSSRI